MKYTQDDISKIRTAFCKAYRGSTGENILQGLTKHKIDEYFDELREDMRAKLGIRNADDKILSAGIFSDFLLNTKKVNYFSSE